MDKTTCECCGDYPWWEIHEDSLDSTTCECSHNMCIIDHAKCIACCGCRKLGGEPELLEERLV